MPSSFFLLPYVAVLMFLQLLKLANFPSRYFGTTLLHTAFLELVSPMDIHLTVESILFYVKKIYDVIIYHFSEPVQVTISQRQTPSGLHERYGI